MNLCEALRQAGGSGFVRRNSRGPLNDVKPGDWIEGFKFYLTRGLKEYERGIATYDDFMADDWEVKPAEVQVTRSHLESAIARVVAAEPRAEKVVGWPEFTRQLAKELGL